MENQIKIADPAPLGLAGFGITTCVLSLINAGVIEAGAMGVVLGLAIAYGGFTQLLAGMWEFRKGNTFGATAFSSYGAFWIAFYFIVKAEPTAGVGYFLLFFGLLTLYLWIGSFYLNRVTFLIFFFLTITFFLLSFHDLGMLGSAAYGGWLGELTGLIALYGSAAGVINGTAGKEVVPVGKPFFTQTTSEQTIAG